MSTEHKTVSHRIPDDLLQQIDRARGHLPRNTWMNMILARAVEGRWPKRSGSQRFVVELAIKEADND